MSRMVSGSNLWPFRWDRIGKQISLFRRECYRSLSHRRLGRAAVDDLSCIAHLRQQIENNPAWSALAKEKAPARDGGSRKGLAARFGERIPRSLGSRESWQENAPALLRRRAGAKGVFRVNHGGILVPPVPTTSDGYDGSSCLVAPTDKPAEPGRASLRRGARYWLGCCHPYSKTPSDPERDEIHREKDD